MIKFLIVGRQGGLWRLSGFWAPLVGACAGEGAMANIFDEVKADKHDELNSQFENLERESDTYREMD